MHWVRAMRAKTTRVIHVHSRIVKRYLETRQSEQLYDQCKVGGLCVVIASFVAERSYSVVKTEIGDRLQVVCGM